MKQQIPAWEAQGTEKRAAVQGLFSRIAKNYDLANRLMSFNRDQKWREIATTKLELKSSDAALDMCCGTGDFLSAIRRKVGQQGQVVGIDFCLPMLEHASTKDESAGLVLGDACNLPFASNHFDGVTVGWGIRNVPDIDQAHDEAFRVLKSGKKFVSLDTAEPKSKACRAFTGVVRTLLMKVLGVSFNRLSEYDYLNESTKRFKSREELAESMRRAGFINVQFQDLMFGNICIHWGTKP